MVIALSHKESCALSFHGSTLYQQYSGQAVFSSHLKAYQLRNSGRPTRPFLCLDLFAQRHLRDTEHFHCDRLAVPIIPLDRWPSRCALTTQEPASIVTSACPEEKDGLLQSDLDQHLQPRGRLA